MSTSAIQFGRTISLQLLPAAPEQDPFTGQDFEQANDALDLSELRIRFQISANDNETPNTAVIRVYNLSAERVKQIMQGGEFSGVTLAAGYGENLATIFKGTVKQFRRGKERNTDSYLDIFAADGDLAYNFGVVNVSLPAGASPDDQLKALADAGGLTVAPGAGGILTIGGINPKAIRGTVMFGLMRVYARSLAASGLCRWSIQDGQLTMIPLEGYLPGDAVVVNSLTGMVGIPEATEQGITVTMLLNPRVTVGRRLQINNRDITETQIKKQFFPRYAELNFVASVDTSSDGMYRAIVVEHVGDTRDQEWYTTVVCLLIDSSAPADKSVQPFG